MKTIQLFSWAAAITLASGSVLARNIQDTPRLVRRQGKTSQGPAVYPPGPGASATTQPQNPGVSTTIQSQSSGVTTTIAPSVSSSTTGSPPKNSSPLTPGCKFGPKARGCWSKDFNIDSDAEERWPNTGKTVYYELEITNTTLAPDGVPKQMLVVNGQYPGPLISARMLLQLPFHISQSTTDSFLEWGDRLEVKVTNKMQNNGYALTIWNLNKTDLCRTSIHWHGFRQLNSNIEDG